MPDSAKKPKRELSEPMRKRNRERGRDKESVNKRLMERGATGCKTDAKLASDRGSFSPKICQS